MTTRETSSAGIGGACTLDVDGRRATQALAIAGGSALLLGLLIAIFSGDMSRLLHSYLVSVMFFVSISVGALFFVLVHHLTRAGWSVVLRRLAEVLAAATPYLFLLFLPILLSLLFGDSRLYKWNSAALRESDPLIQHKAAYLSAPFFAVRSLIYFGVWSLLARFYWRGSLRSDETGDRSLTARLRWWSGPGMIAFAVTATFASFDWLMSLDPHWFSTIYGVYFFAGSTVGFLAALTLCALWLQRRGLLADVITEEHYHDLGKLLFGFVFFWGYIAFSQYLLIWYADLPEETTWYLVRQSGGWKWVSLLLLFGAFLLPFLGLMSRSVKRSRAALAAWSLVLLAMHWIDLYWLIMPHGSPSEPRLGVIDLCCLAATGAFFLAACLRIAGNRSLIPLRDPQLSESAAFENI